MLKFSLSGRFSTTTLRFRSVKTEARISDLGLVLPQISSPKGNYITFLQTGNQVFLSGHLPITNEGTMITGRLGETLSTKEGYEAAKQCGLQMLATLRLNLGDLDRVQQVVKLNGFVNSSNSFSEQATVMNGCSDLFHKVIRNH